MTENWVCSLSHVSPKPWLFILWIFWGAIWLGAALWTAGFRRRPVEQSEWRLSRLSLVVVLIPALFLWTRPAGWLHRPLLSGFFVLPGLLVCALGMAFSFWARFSLNRNWSGMAVIRSGHELVEKGPYRYVRHPIYSGLLLSLAGTALAQGLPLRWVGVWLLSLLAVWFKILGEERLLAERFGEEFKAFRQSTPALLPRLTRRRGQALLP